jgi:aerobic C4-dicarboxylate transport protein
MRSFGKLYVQVLVGVALGVALGYAEPALAIALKPLGDAFIKAIKVVVMPIVFTTVVVGIARLRDLRRIASVGLKALIYFEIASTLALVVGLAAGNLWPIGENIHADVATLDPAAVSTYVSQAKALTLTDFLLGMIPSTFVDPFVKGEILPVLFVAVLFGLGLCHYGDRVQPLVGVIEQISRGLFGMVRIIMYAAPAGAFAAMAFTVGKFGMRTLLELGELVLAVFVVCLAFILVVFGTALRLCGLRLLRVLAYFKEEILFVFAATSSEAMMPRTMEKLERLGCAKEVVGLVMPAGFSFNMDGAAIYMSMAVLFLAHATHVDLSLWQQFTILFVMLFTSKGVVGVTGGGFVALAATIPVVGVLPVGSLALLLGVDRFMSEIRAAANLTSNIVATVVVARWTGSLDLAEARRQLGQKRAERSISEPRAVPIAAAPATAPAPVAAM